mmetsp:Transcript_43185/g.101527  ORF Transcript_43185/g.101527 Transcript_43185/m.101527 type:complete len:860 (+) Transcript_43185:141-2720(+)
MHTQAMRFNQGCGVACRAAVISLTCLQVVGGIHVPPYREQPGAFLRQDFPDSVGRVEAVQTTQHLLGSVYGESAGYPAGANQSVELLRFITAYGTGLEVLIDVTPYIPLLHVAASARQELRFYSYIETWVGNSTGNAVLFVNTTSDQCQAVNHFDGNGWSLNADLVVWPKSSQEEADTKPFAAVTLATGRFGSAYPIGSVSLRKGNMTTDGSAIVLENPAALEGVAGASVYLCSGNGEQELRRASILGYLAQQAKFLRGSTREENLQMLAENVFDMFAGEHLLQASVQSMGADNRTARVSYNSSLADVQVGSPIFLSGSEVLTAVPVSAGGYALVPVSLEPVGNVTHVHPGMLDVQLKYPCFGQAQGLPSIYVAKRSGALQELWALINETIRFGDQQAEEASAEDYLQEGPWFVRQQNGTLEHVPVLAHLQVGGSGSLLQLDSAPPIRDATDRTVCIVSHQQHGAIFAREFELPALEPGARAVMQLVVTGHGWAATSEQCGEYCHAVYRFTINGKSAVNVTQWRDDCKDNPIGPNQRGTWDESRNGWCPGSAEPGLFIDMTPYVEAGLNRLSMDLLVWSNATWSYAPYTNYGGFAMRDHASLSTGLTFFVYRPDAVEAVQLQPRAFTAAEAAIRDGCSMPSALEIPAIPRPGVPVSLAELSHSEQLQSHRSSAALKARRSRYLEPSVYGLLEPSPVSKEAAGGALSNEEQWRSSFIQAREGDSHFDFEQRAPWYFYNSSAEGVPGAGTNVTLTNIFSDVLVQGRNQIVTATISSQHVLQILEWDQTSQVALHLKLERPHAGNLQIDHWDRQGSFGLMLDDADMVGNPALMLHRSPVPEETRRWSVARPVAVRKVSSDVY